MGFLRRQRDGAAEGFTDEESAVPSAPTTVTPLDIQQKEFGVSRFGGYKMRDVDVFLDQLTDVVSTLMAENERIRGSGSGAHVAIGEPELADVRRQADEMIARAREEAAKIVADARVRAMGIGSSPASGDERAAIDAFLAQERAFLQGLGRLVQDHAESVKTMARTARRRPAVAAPEPASVAATEALRSADAGEPEETGPEATGPEATGPKETGPKETGPEPREEAETAETAEAASAVEGVEESSAWAPSSPEPSTPATRTSEPSAPPAGPPAPAPEPEPEPERVPASSAERTKMPPAPAPPDTIRIEDPEPAVSSRRDSGETPRRESSLRELFWGEEG
jgi:DivIVA domain-containing protein